jgi:hypothetical protein
MRSLKKKESTIILKWRNINEENKKNPRLEGQLIVVQMYNSTVSTQEMSNPREKNVK